MRRHQLTSAQSGLAAGQMLVVIVIIGVLAAGVVVLIRGQRNSVATQHVANVPSSAQLVSDGSTKASEEIDALEIADESKATTKSTDSYTSTLQTDQNERNTIGNAYDEATF